MDGTGWIYNNSCINDNKCYSVLFGNDCFKGVYREMVSRLHLSKMVNIYVHKFKGVSLTSGMLPVMRSARSVNRTGN